MSKVRKYKRSKVVVAKEMSKQTSAATKWLIVGALVATVSIFTGWLIAHHQNHSKKAVSSPCATAENDDLLGKLALAPSVTLQQQLGQKLNELKKVPNYQKDPNCLYFFVTYYLNVSDYKNSTDYFNQMEKVYSPKSGFDDKLTNAISFKDIKSSVAVLQDAVKQSQQSVRTFGNPKE